MPTAWKKLNCSSNVFVFLTGRGEKGNGILPTGKIQLRRIERHGKPPNHFALFYKLIIRDKGSLVNLSTLKHKRIKSQLVSYIDYKEVREWSLVKLINPAQ